MFQIEPRMIKDKLPPMFSGICVAQSVGFCVVFCWPLFLSLFSKASLYLSFLDFRLLITPWYLQTVFHKSIIQNTILLLLGYCLQTKSTFSFIITGSIGISGRLKNILIKCNRLWRWRISLICIWLIKSTSTLYFTIDVVLYRFDIRLDKMKSTLQVISVYRKCMSACYFWFSFIISLLFHYKWFTKFLLVNTSECQWIYQQRTCIIVVIYFLDEHGRVIQVKGWSE